MTTLEEYLKMERANAEGLLDRLSALNDEVFTLMHQ
jgi:hypothetical protein